MVESEVFDKYFLFEVKGDRWKTLYWRGLKNFFSSVWKIKLKLKDTITTKLTEAHLIKYSMEHYGWLLTNFFKKFEFFI